MLVLGFRGLPQAGEIFLAVEDEHRARELSAQRELMDHSRRLAPKSKLTLLNLQDKIQKGETKELKILLKADTSGSVEALDEKLQELSTDEATIRIVHQGVGKINVSDVLLAEVTGSICVGFHVGPDANAMETAEREGVEIRTYRLIYEALDDLRSAMVGMLEPEEQEKGRGPGGEGLAELLHEAVADADVGQFAADGAGAGAHRGPQQRVEKDQADQHAPEAAPRGAPRPRTRA